LAIPTSCSKKGRKNVTDLSIRTLDTADHVHIRAQAVAALSKLDAAEPISRLRPLLMNDPNDIDDELRGSVLEALWPRFISLRELIATLAVPKRSNLIGAYYHFLWVAQFPPINSEEAILLIEWLSAERVEEEQSFFEEMIARALDRVWQHLDDDGVLDKFAQFLVDVVARHHRLPSSKGFLKFLETVGSDDQTRRRLLKRIIRISLGNNSPIWLIIPDIRPVAPKSTKLNVILVRLGSVSKNKNQFVTRSIERSHAAVALDPDTQIEELAA
jgi:hypothetical protein